MKLLFPFLAVLAFAPLASSAPVELPQYGFSIEPLDAPAPTVTVTALMSSLPPTEGFSPNLNVQIQPFPGTLKEYAELSRGQFAEMKLRVISDTLKSDQEWIAEYEGVIQNATLHFYARALSKNGKVYLVTATATPTQWPAVGELLKKHVATFQLK